jgi:hypothetical protein
MSKGRQTIASIGISVALAAALWTVPASANDVRKVAATGDMRTAKRVAVHVHSKPRLARRQPTRVASLYPTGCSWSCDRHFTLIIGIGF